MGSEWHGVCPLAQPEGKLAVIGDRWICHAHGCHQDHDDEIGFRLLAVPLLGEREIAPVLLKPEPPEPSYGLQRLAGDQRPVLIVDHRKHAKAAITLLPSYIPVAWPDGGERWTALEPLQGRKVLLWPSTEGMADMLRLEALLGDPRGLACSGKMLTEGLNLADWSGSVDELLTWARGHSRPLQVPAPQAVVAPGPSQGQAAESAGDVNPPSIPSPPPPAEAGPTEASESLRTGGEPPEPQPSDFPAEATTTRPKRPRRRLQVVGGAAVDAMESIDPDAAPIPHELSESGIATHFVAMHKDRFRTVHEWAGKQGACWMAWDGSRWVREPSRVTAMQQAQTLCNGVKYWEAARGVAELSKVKFESRKFIGAVLDLASYAPDFVASPLQFDADPFLLGTPAGTVDLRLGKLMDPDPDQYMTRQTSVAPAKGPHPLFDDVIRRASAGEPDMADYLWRWLGLLCTGDISQEVFLYAVGKPQSGKTTLVSAIAEILGDVGEGGYAAHCDIEMFTETKIDKGNDRLAHLAGARFAYASEMEEGRNFKTALLKMATGGDKLSGRFLYSEKFSFTATHKLWITGNHMLHLKSSDAGLKRRLHLLEYKDAFIVTDEERDNSFKERLKAEYPAILHSMIEAVRQYLECGGLGRPERITQAVEEYTTNEDTLAQWIAECLDIDTKQKTPASAAYECFRKWAEKEGAFAPSAKRFSQQLTERGYARARSGGTRYFCGFTIKSGANL